MYILTCLPTVSDSKLSHRCLKSHSGETEFGRSEPGDSRQTKRWFRDSISIFFWYSSRLNSWEKEYVCGHINLIKVIMTDVLCHKNTYIQKHSHTWDQHIRDQAYYCHCPSFYEPTLRSHSCSLTDSRSVSTMNSSVDLSSADFNQSKRPCKQHKTGCVSNTVNTVQSFS